MSYSPKRVLITGGAGFIGSNFVHWLCEHQSLETLVVLDKLTYAGRESLLDPVREKIQFIEGDICDRELVMKLMAEQELDTVFHLAAESHVDRSIEDASVFVQTNVLGTFVLLDSFRRASPEGRFVLVSTDEVYGALGETGVFTEESSYAPNSPYAASKASADLFARAYFKTFGQDVVVTNCSNNYGPRQFPEKLIPLMIVNARTNQPLPVYGEGKQVRDWLHVEDHCAGIWAAATLGKSGEKYNFGGGFEAPDLQIVETIADLVDESEGRPLGESKKLITFVEDRAGHDFRYAIDPAKAERELGWSAKWSFEDGLRDTVRWYKDNA